MANDLDQSVSNAIAGGVSAPIDLIAWALRKAGVPGLEKPVGGADWMAEKGLTRPVQPGPGQVVGETIGNLVDPLSGLSAAAKTAILIPALASRGWKLENAARDAIAGAGHQELWDKHRVFKYPGQLTGDLRVPTGQAKFGSEIPQGTLRLNREGALPDILENKGLYHEVPGLDKVLVKLRGHPDSPKSQGVYAHHEGPGGVIYVDPKESVDLENTFWHELNHAINSHTGQTGTLGAHARFDTLSPVMKQQIPEMANLLERDAPDLPLLVEHLRRAGKVSPNRVWATSAGERLAEADAFRAMNPATRSLSPIMHMNKGNSPLLPVEKPIPDDIMLNLEHSLLLHEGDPASALSYLLRKLK